jgi:DNA-binding CsgD family transcriptional regulator
MTGDREMAFNRAASLLALGCMVRGNSPADYAVWISAENHIIDRIKQHADELLHLGRTLSCSVDLSPRENEVLRELLHHRINKEIADRLRISVRTVKFHVSSLLAKFGVGSRWDLIQKAQPMLHSQQLADGFAALQSTEPAAVAPASESSHPQISKDRKPERNSQQISQNAERRVVPFHSRLRPA